MVKETQQHLEQILNLARKTFSALEIKRHEISEEIAILKFRCRHGDRDIAVTEILDRKTRWYSYYLIREGKVLIGLDNMADKDALRLKYGDKEFSRHLDEPIPHKHTEGKQELQLTDEQTFTDFVQIVLRQAP